MINKVIIIEDNEDVSNAFSLLIGLHDDFAVVNTYTNCEDAIENMKSDCPDIILMDIDLPGMSGIEGTKIIKKDYPETNIIIITVFENSKTVFDALCAGAVGYLTKSSDKGKLLSALEEVASGGSPMSAKIARMVVQSFQRNTDSPLSDRETEILSLLSKGKSYAGIAETLFISKDTVKYHIKNIYLKLQVSSKEEAINKANTDRLI